MQSTLPAAHRQLVHGDVDRGLEVRAVVSLHREAMRSRRHSQRRIQLVAGDFILLYAIEINLHEGHGLGIR